MCEEKSTALASRKEIIIQMLRKYNINSTETYSKEDLISLLEDQNALNYFKFHPDLYCETHKLILKEFKDVHELTAFYGNSIFFPKYIKENDTFPVTFLEILAPELAKFLCKFGDDGALLEISKIFQKCVFSSKEFDSFLKDLFETKNCSDHYKICNVLFNLCTTNFSIDTANALFKLCLNSYYKTPNSVKNVYKMAFVLIEILGFDVLSFFNIKIKWHLKDASFDEALHILNGLLSVIAQKQFDMQFEIQKLTFSNFLKNILLSVIRTSKTPTDECYETIIKILEINPLILETVIDELLVYTMLCPKPKSKTYENLMILIFAIFSKLHRIQNLVTKITTALKEGITKRKVHAPLYPFKGVTDFQFPSLSSITINDIFPQAILDTFGECILNLASWQVINLFRVILFHLKKIVEEGQLTENILYIEILSSLICRFLLNVRIAEHTITENSVKKFVNDLEQLKATLRNFGTSLLNQEHNLILMRAFLSICYHWAEIYMTLEYYSINDEVKMLKKEDTNLTSYNMSFMHSYLSDTEWCLIGERINNFGEKPCRLAMQKLMVQKIRAFFIFRCDASEEIFAEIIRSLCSDLDEESVEIFIDRFIVNNILTSMPPSNVLKLSEILLQMMLENKLNFSKHLHIFDSLLITNGIISVLFSKINKLCKQKRKLEDKNIRKAQLSKAFTTLTPNLFLENNKQEIMIEIAKIVTGTTDEFIDLKIKENKLLDYVEILTKLPIPFCDDDTQKIIQCLLISLHQDVKHCNCDKAQKKIECVLISIAEHSRFSLLDIFDTKYTLNLLHKNFVRANELFLQMARKTLKDNDGIFAFKPGIDIITKKLPDNTYLKFAVTVISILNKAKKAKISSESKEICMNYKNSLCEKLVLILINSEPKEGFVEAYSLSLKHYISCGENTKVAQLKEVLPQYLEFCSSQLPNVDIRGCLMLFSIILHNKAIFSSLEDYSTVGWDIVKKLDVKSEIWEEYTQLVALLAISVPSDKFSHIFEDLQETTKDSIDIENDEAFGKQLKLWSSILSTNFNSTKMEVLRNHLESLFEKLLILLLSRREKAVLKEITNLEIALIQANHVPLTAAIMDFLLLSVSTLLMGHLNENFYESSLSILLLENLLKYRKPLIMDRLPPFLLPYRMLVKKICAKGSTSNQLQQSEIQTVEDCVHNLEKLTKILVECTRDMSRIAMYLVADILAQFELHTLYPNVKKHLNNCVYNLISLCDQHAMQYLMRVLSNASTEILKLMYANYKKYHRFTGKI